MKYPTIEKVVTGEDCRLQKIELSRLTPCRGCGATCPEADRMRRRKR